MLTSTSIAHTLMLAVVWALCYKDFYRPIYKCYGDFLLQSGYYFRGNNSKISPWQGQCGTTLGQECHGMDSGDCFSVFCEQWYYYYCIVHWKLSRAYWYADCVKNVPSPCLPDLPELIVSPTGGELFDPPFNYKGNVYYSRAAYFAFLKFSPSISSSCEQYKVP